MPAPYSHTVPLSVLADRPEWQFRGRCFKGDLPLETFFPPKSLGPQGVKKAYNEARRICASCSTREECLRWAIEHKITDGMFGGKTPRERRALARGFSVIKQPVEGRDSEGRFVSTGTKMSAEERRRRQRERDRKRLATLRESKNLPRA